MAASTPALILSTASVEANEIAVRSTGSSRVCTTVIVDCLPPAMSSSGWSGKVTTTSTLPSCSCCWAAAASAVVPTMSTYESRSFVYLSTCPLSGLSSATTSIVFSGLALSR